MTEEKTEKDLKEKDHGSSEGREFQEEMGIHQYQWPQEMK